jgi:DHA1 family tetracycline resistance protein-like MFS transporter
VRRSPLAAIFLTVFIDLLGFGILIPVFPLLISEGSPFRVTPEAWSFTEGLVMLGWLQAVYPFFVFVAAPILGQLSDRHGRRPVLALSIFGTGVGYFLFAVGIMTANIPLLFASRALDGITGGNLAVANAAIGDISTNENRAKNFGVLGAAFGLGFIIGPYLGGKLSSPGVSFYGLFDTPGWFGATTPFWFAGILSLVNCAMVLRSLPETLSQKVDSGRVKLTKAVSNVVEGFGSDRLRVVLLGSLLFNAGFTFFTTFFGVYLRNNFGFDSSRTGDYFALVGLAIALAQVLLVPRVAARLVDYKVLRFSMFGTASMMLVYFVTPPGESLWLYLAIPFFTSFNGLTMANMSSLVSRSAEMGKQGQAMGIASSVQSLAAVPASVLVGYITSGITSSQPLVVACLCIAAGGLSMLVLFRPTYVESVPGAATGPAAH